MYCVTEVVKCFLLWNQCNQVTRSAWQIDTGISTHNSFSLRINIQFECEQVFFIEYNDLFLYAYVSTVNANTLTGY